MNKKRPALAKVPAFQLIEKQGLDSNWSTYA